jgi:hypothetical protein
MIGWLKNLNDASRLISINEASRISGISAKALEKNRGNGVIICICNYFN